MEEKGHQSSDLGDLHHNDQGKVIEEVEIDLVAQLLQFGQDQDMLDIVSTMIATDSIPLEVVMIAADGTALTVHTKGDILTSRTDLQSIRTGTHTLDDLHELVGRDGDATLKLDFINDQFTATQIHELDINHSVIVSLLLVLLTDNVQKVFVGSKNVHVDGIFVLDILQFLVELQCGDAGHDTIRITAIVAEVGGGHVELDKEIMFGIDLINLQSIGIGILGIVTQEDEIALTEQV